jgi:hypothetical protein
MTDTTTHTTSLRITWGISRGMNTYGYNICRLADETAGKRFRCMGGGYDMVGTVLADWAVATHQDRLLKLADQSHAVYRKGTDGGYSTRTDSSGLYGMTRYEDADGNVTHVSIDGACGVESVTRILRDAGLSLTRTHNRNGNTTGWIVTH